ncbi:MAG: YbbR-like domain-containing protein [Candidatus Omnitrophica bacterium]|nr:YbbR-like domain-containing protein [Candidatus Omnitrophota bacterium]
MNQRWIANSFLKIVALGLAVGAYAYIGAELRESPGTLPLAVSKEYIAKSVAVRVDLLGRPPRGFQVQKDRILVEPEKVMIIGPEGLIGSLEYLETQPIYIGRRGGEVRARVGLKITRGIQGMEQQRVDVVIPIERIKK